MNFYLADKRTPTVSLARVFPLLPASTDKTGVESELVTKSRPLQLPLAVAVVEDRHVDLLQGVLVRSVPTEGIFSPAADEATFPRELC